MGTNKECLGVISLAGSTVRLCEGVSRREWLRIGGLSTIGLMLPELRSQPTDFPCFGAVMNYFRPGRGQLPAGISLNSPANQVSASNHIFPGFFAGFLGSAYDPLFVSQDLSQADFRPFPSVDGPAAQR